MPLTNPAASGSVAPNLVAGGSLGASRSLGLSASQETWLTGTLTADHALTLTGLAAGAKAVVILNRDAVSRTLTINGTAYTVAGTNTASGVWKAEVEIDDSLNVIVDVAGGGTPGPQGATGATGATGAQGTTGLTGPAGTNGAISQVQDEGSNLTVRSKLNFVGAGVTAADNSGTGATDVTIPGGGGSVSAATAAALGTTKIVGTPTDAANPTVRVRENADLVYAGRGAASALKPRVALAQTFPRATGASFTSFNPLVSQRLTLIAIELVSGVTYTGAAFIAGSTGLSGGNHQFFSLHDDDLGTTSGTALSRLAVSADDTSTAWASTATKSLNFTSTYTPTRSGLFYLGVLVDATTVPLLQSGGAMTGAIASLVPYLVGASSTGVTAVPATPAAMTSLVNPVYGYIY